MNYEFNRFLTHRFDGNNFLLSAEPGNWVLLNKRELELVKKDDS